MNNSINSLDHAFDAASHSATDAAQEVESNLENAAHSLKNFTEDLRARSGEKFSEINDRTRQALQEARQRAESFFGDAKVKVRTLEEDGEEFVRANPIKVVVGAAAIGLVIGMLMRK